MSHDTFITLLVENRAEELIAEGIFADLVREGLVRIRMCWESSSLISIAEFSLLKNPRQPVAIILNGGSAPNEVRDPTVRILARAAPQGPWHVALAIPDMTTWLRLDPQLSETLTQKRGDQASKIDVAVFFKDWRESRADYQFDRDRVATNDSEFAGLQGFVSQHLAIKASTA